eukprot:ANDGO_04316.mRNA.1 Protein SDS23
MTPNPLFQHFDSLQVSHFVRSQSTIAISADASALSAFLKIKEARVSCLPILSSAFPSPSAPSSPILTPSHSSDALDSALSRTNSSTNMISSSTATDNGSSTAPLTNASGASHGHATAKCGSRVVGQVDTMDMVSLIASHLPMSIDPRLPRSSVPMQNPLPSVCALSIADRSGRNPFVHVRDDERASVLVDYFAKGLHRVLVFNSEKQMVGVVSQMTLCQALAAAIPKIEALQCMCDKQLCELGLEARLLTTVDNDTPVSEAVAILAQTRFSALAVTDAVTNKLVGNFSAVDVAGLFRSVTDVAANPTNTDAGAEIDGKGMEKNTLSDLEKEMQKVALGEKRLEESRVGLTVEEFLREVAPKSLEPICVATHATLYDALQKMVDHKVHRVWVVDEIGEPVGVVSFTDIFILAADTTSHLS